MSTATAPPGVETHCGTCEHGSRLDADAPGSPITCSHVEVIAMNGNRPRVLAAAMYERVCRGRLWRPETSRVRVFGVLPQAHRAGATGAGENVRTPPARDSSERREPPAR